MPTLLSLGQPAAGAKKKGYSLSVLVILVKGCANAHLLRNIEWDDEKRLSLMRFVHKIMGKQVCTSV